MSRTDARRVIVELIRKADGEVTGKTRLFKAFYFAHGWWKGTQKPENSNGEAGSRA